MAEGIGAANLCSMTVMSVIKSKMGTIKSKMGTIKKQNRQKI